MLFIKKRRKVKKSIAIPFHAFIFILVSCLPACIHRNQIDRQKLNFDRTIPKFTGTQDTPPPITIWVHGTLVFRTPIYHYIFNKKSCLVKTTELPENNHFRIIAQTIAEHDAEHFPLEEFYIFSWSGRLQNKERKDAAEKLYQEIIKLSEEYQKKYCCQPVIRILAHSHGAVSYTHLTLPTILRV